MWHTFVSDYFGVIGFVIIATALSWFVDHSPWRKHSLSDAMDRQRVKWMQEMARRDMRILDSQVLGGLQNGMAFFASTALLGIGAAFTLLTAIDSVMAATSDIPALAEVSRTQWEAMSIGLLIIYAYGFFKFGWAYRLLNYSAILFAAVAHCPPDQEPSDEMRRQAERAAQMNIVAARQFNRGLRTLFMSIGYLAWIGGPLAQILVTLIVAMILIYRQYASPALAPLRSE